MATFGTSTEFVVTLKYYYEKKSKWNVLETTLNCLYFKVPLEFSFDIRI